MPPLEESVFLSTLHHAEQGNMNVELFSPAVTKALHDRKMMMAAKKPDPPAFSACQSPVTVISRRVMFAEQEEFSTKVYSPYESPSRISSKRKITVSLVKSTRRNSCSGISNDVPSPTSPKPRQRNSVSFMDDTSLMNTAVFHQRLNRPVVLLQAAFRAAKQRKEYRERRMQQLLRDIEALTHMAATRIQTQVRRFQNKSRYVMYQAAVHIQRTFRGFHDRCIYRVSSLERTLRRIEEHHQMELEQIEHQKKKEMKRIRRELARQAMTEEKAEQHSLLESSLELEELKLLNMKLRKENDSMRAAVSAMALQNKKLVDTLDQYNSHIDELEAYIPPLEDDVDKMEDIEAQFLERIEKYQDAIARVDEFIDFEQQVSSRFYRATLTMLDHIQEQCRNDRLVQAIVAMSTPVLEARETS